MIDIDQAFHPESSRWRERLNPNASETLAINLEIMELEMHDEVPLRRR